MFTFLIARETVDRLWVLSSIFSPTKALTAYSTPKGLLSLSDSLPGCIVTELGAFAGNRNVNGKAFGPSRFNNFSFLNKL